MAIESWQLADNDLFQRTVAVTFAWGDATPLDLGTVPAGKVIESVSVIITQAFDGTGASLTVGDAGDSDRFMATTDNDPTQTGGYETHPGYSYGTDTMVRLTITPGSGASQGQGLATIKYSN